MTLVKNLPTFGFFLENVSLGESEKRYSNESWGTVGKHGENMAKIWGKIGKYEGNMAYECLNAFKTKIW